MHLASTEIVQLPIHDAVVDDTHVNTDGNADDRTELDCITSGQNSTRNEPNSDPKRGDETNKFRIVEPLSMQTLHQPSFNPPNSNGNSQGGFALKGHVKDFA